MPVASSSSFFARLLDFPKLIIFVVLAIALAFSLALPNFRLDASADSLVLQNDQSLSFYREIRKRYGSDDYLLITFTPFESLFEQQSLNQLDAMTDALKAVVGVSDVINILNVPLIQSPNVSVDSLQQHIPTLSDDEVDLSQAQSELVSSPIYQDLLISRDSKTTSLLVNLEVDEAYLQQVKRRNELQELSERPLTTTEKAELKQLREHISDLAEQMQIKQAKVIQDVRQVLNNYRSVASIHLGGVPMITADSIDYVRHDLVTFGVGVLAFVIITLTIAFSRVRWVIVPLITCFFAGLIMTGFLALMDWPLTVVSSNFLALMLIITLSITIHLIVQYQEYHWQHPNASQKEILAFTLKHKFYPSLFTTLTTMVAFVSLIVSQVQPVIDFGWMMAIGTALAFVLTFSLFPAILSLFKPTKPVDQNNVTERLTSAIAAVLVPNKGKILLSYLVVLLVSIWGLQYLSVENRFIDYFKKDTEIYQGMALIDQKLGGTTPLDVIINAPTLPELPEISSLPAQNENQDDLFAELDLDEEDLAELDSEDENLPAITKGYWFNPTQLKQVAEYHNYLDGLSETGKVLSVHSAISLLSFIAPEVVEDAFTLSVIYSKLPQEVNEIVIAPYLSDDGNQLRFSIRVFESDPSLERQKLLDKIQSELVAKFDLQPEQIEFSGMFVLYNNLLQSLFKSQILTLGVVFVMILLMFVILFRHLWLSLIAIVPNILSAFLILGLMGWFNIPLDLMTITIAAICIGIAVDDSIHYVHRFRIELQQTGEYVQAMLNTHGSIGRAMYYTSATITLGFSILVLSNFIPSIYFGVLTGLSMVIALIANLTLLPLLLVMLKPLKIEKTKEVG